MALVGHVIRYHLRISWSASSHGAVLQISHCAQNFLRRCHSSAHFSRLLIPSRLAVMPQSAITLLIRYFPDIRFHIHHLIFVLHKSDPKILAGCRSDATPNAETLILPHTGTQLASLYCTPYHLAQKLALGSRPNQPSHPRAPSLIMTH
jgi:hypothetical protein